MKKIYKFTILMLLALLCTTFVHSHTAKADSSYRKGNTTYYIKTTKNGTDKYGVQRYKFTLMKKKYGNVSKVCTITSNKYSAEIVHYDEGYVYVQVAEDCDWMTCSIYEVDVEYKTSSRTKKNFEVNDRMPQKQRAYKSWIIGKSHTTAPGSFNLKVLDVDMGEVKKLGTSAVQYRKGKYLYYVDSKGLYDTDVMYTTKTQTVKIKCYNLESGKIYTLKKVKVNKGSIFSKISNKQAKYYYYTKSGKEMKYTIKFKGKN